MNLLLNLSVKERRKNVIVTNGLRQKNRDRGKGRKGRRQMG
jgi:hypothetical protein